MLWKSQQHRNNTNLEFLREDDVFFVSLIDLITPFGKSDFQPFRRLE